MTSAVLPILLTGLEGLAGRLNDVVVVKASGQCACMASAATVVFFGGDVQDLESQMLARKKSKAFAKWSLEGTAASLAESAPPGAAVVVVRPAQMLDGTYSKFKHFLACDAYGDPTSDSTGTFKQQGLHLGAGSRAGPH